MKKNSPTRKEFPSRRRNWPITVARRPQTPDEARRFHEAAKALLRVWIDQFIEDSQQSQQGEGNQ